MGKIIAVVGMCGAGKSEAVKFFVDKGYRRVYFGDTVLDEINRQGLEAKEKNERLVREQLRREYGMAAMAVLNLDKIKELEKKGNVVIESLYSWEEYKVIKEVFEERFRLLAVYTTKELRHKRLSLRKERPLTREEAVSRDIREIEVINKAGPIAYADYLVMNNGSFDELQEQLGAYI